MQSRPGPSGDRFYPPTAPQIPLAAIQSLIPRLTTTINDIDTFKHLLAQGAQDGSMPNWETLLQRYALLLGRINALSTYLAQPGPVPAARPGVPRPPPDLRPALDKYLVHPLNPLSSSSTADPNAPEAFFQVINTQSIPGVSAAQAELVDRPASAWTSKADLQRMGETELAALTQRLKGRLEREGKVADRVREMLEKHGEEYDWGMRVGGGDEAEEGNAGDTGGGEGARNGVQEEDEDLFGDDDEDEGGSSAAKPTGAAATAAPVTPNPREGWKVADYVRYMDTGIEPKLPP